MVDASIAIRWFEPVGGRRVGPAQKVLAEYQAGRLRVVVPPLLFLELLNVAGRQWRWSEDALLRLTTRLEELLFEIIEPELGGVAAWVARGLTAYDAAYVALAQQRDVPLVTDDAQVISLAAGIARRAISG